VRPWWSSGEASRFLWWSYELGKRSGMCGGSRWEGWESLEGSGMTAPSYSMVSHRSSPARSIGVRTRRPGGVLAKFSEGKRRGWRGGLNSCGRKPNGARNGANWWGEIAVSPPVISARGWRRWGVLTCGAGLSVKGGQGVNRFRRIPGWAVGRFYGWAEGFPRGPIRYFFSFSSFSFPVFLFSLYLLHFIFKWLQTNL
jgi:hypothetical protein